MGKVTSWCAVLAGGVALLSLTGCDKLRSRDQRNQGVHDFESAKYSDAIEHFTKAVELDPTDPINRSYLATSYFAQWIPGATSPQNEEMASRARNEIEAHWDMAMLTRRLAEEYRDLVRRKRATSSPGSGLS